MRTISTLLENLEVKKIIGSLDISVNAIVTDSRRVKAGDLFVAVCGVNVDSHRFLPEVISAGVSAVVVEQLPERLDNNVTYIVVDNSLIALGYLASGWYGTPSGRLKLVGVTGTNGKTTTATLLYELFRHLGYKTGLLSTVANYVDNRVVASTHTTPDSLQLNALLAEMVEAGCEYAFMEVSSHAAHQHRIAGLHFDGGIFTNLTRDHLDYHKTVPAYIAAKKSFFDQLPATAWALVNADDRNGSVMLQNTQAGRHTYALRSDADYRGRVIENRLDGMLLQINGTQVETLFSGLFNAYNLTAVAGAAILLGVPREEVMVSLSSLVPVAGRFETLRAPSGQKTAIVDYAHTPDAVVNLLTTIRDVIGADRAIITVIGAGGNRDAGKRPIMGREAARLSDRVILTSDNPRDENPNDIINQMREGITDESQRAATIAIVDRAEAIKTAIALAGPNDVVVVAGKGHETYQEIAGKRHHFDDREIINNQFKMLK